MADARLPTGLWVRAHLARLSASGAPAMVIHRGDADRGLVLLKQSLPHGLWRVLAQSSDLDTGRLIWRNAFETGPVAEEEADAYIDRQRGYDPDLWVIEVDGAREPEGWD